MYSISLGFVWLSEYQIHPELWPQELITDYYDFYTQKVAKQ